MAALLATGAAALMNLLVLLGMAFVLSRGFGVLRSRPKTQQTAILSVAFGVMAVGSMMVSFPIGPGIIGDFRNAVIAIAAIVGGPIPALVAAAAAAAYRVYLGGQFTVAVIGIAIAAGLSIGFSWSRLPKSPFNLVLFGVALAAGNALLPIVASLLSTMPMSRAFGVAATIFVVAVVLYPLTITVIGGLLKSEQQRANDEAELRSTNEALSLDAARVRREGLKVDLVAALSNNEFEVEYQPIVSVQTGAVTSFEALLRWRHPREGMISPSEFIPLAEEAHLIGFIGAWVLDQACTQAMSWPTHIGVAVNVSPAQLRGPTLALRVVEALGKSGLGPHRLELEITETVLLHGGDDDLQCLRDLHELGVKVALDDFGTGYSSLSYLQRFPFDRIKIDRSFVSDVTSFEQSKAVIRAVVGLGHTLNMRITAEGVETTEQLDRIRAKGCDEAQGFLISKSMPPSELPALITRLAVRPDIRIVEPTRLSA
jgi:EAL domain-containing protein (putative c-di-GMP-specific phosphodiesterase class I)